MGPLRFSAGKRYYIFYELYYTLPPDNNQSPAFRSVADTGAAVICTADPAVFRFRIQHCSVGAGTHGCFLQEEIYNLIRGAVRQTKEGILGGSREAGRRGRIAKLQVVL